MCFYSIYASREAVQYLSQHKNIIKLLIFRHVFALTSGMCAKYSGLAFGLQGYLVFSSQIEESELSLNLFLNAVVFLK